MPHSWPRRRGVSPTPSGGFLSVHRVLICDRDGKWTAGFRDIVEGSGVRVVLTPLQAPNANAHAERFVRSIREECLDRLILFRSEERRVGKECRCWWSLYD